MERAEEVLVEINLKVLRDTLRLSEKDQSLLWEMTEKCEEIWRKTLH